MPASTPENSRNRRKASLFGMFGSSPAPSSLRHAVPFSFEAAPNTAPRNNENHPSAPCDFMPQPATPMTMFFTDRRANNENRGMRRSQRPGDISTTHTADERAAIDATSKVSGYETVPRSGTEARTPATLPVDGSSRHSRPFRFERSGVVKETAAVPKGGGHARMFVEIASWACCALLLVYIFKPEYIEEAVSASLEWVSEKAPVASEMLETGIESAGFVVGRAAARFGKEFAKGYNI